MNGALANLPNNRNQPFSYNLIGQRSNVVPTFSSGRKFQDYIGTSALPTFKYVESIITGQRQYNPNSAEDRAYMQDYASWKGSNPDVAGAPSVGDLTKGLVADLAPLAGASIGQAFVDPLVTGNKFSAGFKNIFSGNPTSEALKLAGQFSKTGVVPPITADLTSQGVTEDMVKNLVTSPEEGISAFDYLNPKTTAGSTNIASAAGGAVANFGVQLLMGQEPAKAARSAGAGMILGTLGGAIGGPFGRFFGQAIGGALGGRVICNELMKQGLMTKEDVLMDYKFTRDYLTPQHVNGYHMWAVWVVKKMRQGKMVKFWKHIAKHRANEIAYIYGKKDKPDYLGKIYRKVGESVCWLLGGFAKATDWSVLYKEKEI